VSFENFSFSLRELNKIYCIKFLLSYMNDKLVLFIILNVIIFYAPIENYSDNFLFKIKMAIKQTIEGITGLIITIIPKYEPNEKPKEAEKEKKL
jgi:hypothetical protein